MPKLTSIQSAAVELAGRGRLVLRGGYYEGVTGARVACTTAHSLVARRELRAVHWREDGVPDRLVASSVQLSLPLRGGRAHPDRKPRRKHG
jgi:hypothetical protein